jgi:ubiquinone/menaquinone biosynthesis C-methylase UbiE
VNDATLGDLQGPAGNTYDKYETRNPVARRLVAGFLKELDAQVRWSSAASVLDVGCGEGIGTARMANVLPQARVVGLDVADPGLLQEWKTRAHDRIEFVAASAYELPFADDSFDLVSAIEVFEHLQRPERALAEIARVSRRGLLLSVPWEPVWRGVNMAAGRYVRQYGNTPGHINHWTRRGFVALAGTAGEVVAVRRPFPWTMVAVHVRP